VRIVRTDFLSLGETVVGVCPILARAEQAPLTIFYRLAGFLVLNDNLVDDVFTLARGDGIRDDAEREAIRPETRLERPWTSTTRSQHGDNDKRRSKPVKDSRPRRHA